jgi:hypothetical protein
MRACTFPGARAIGEPLDWVTELDGDCGTIYVVDAIDVQSGMNMMYSFYQPTPEDLAALNAGGCIRLGVMGRAHPVFQLGVFGPLSSKASGIKPAWDMGPVIGA